jgi:hypothetical protein
LFVLLSGVRRSSMPLATRASQLCTDPMLWNSSPQDCASDSDWLY